MRVFTLLCSAAVLAGCAKKADTAATDSAATMAPAATMGPAPLALADLAGTWNMSATPEGAAAPMVQFQMVATADQNGWTNTFKDRPAVPVRVVLVDGDSVVTETGPNESVLRKGVQVTTRSVMRLQDGKLVGSTVARYVTTGADSVLNLRSEGTRAP